MWLLFKLTNIFWLLVSTYWWAFAIYNQGPILVIVNVLMIISLSMLPVKIRFDIKTGCIMGAILLIGIWYLWLDGPSMGLTMVLKFLPALYLIELPLSYKIDLLNFTTKIYALLLIPALLIYWMCLFTTVPSIGRYVHPEYQPFINHIFYLETTFDHGTFVRFNAFFLEPGHQALLSTFMMIANRFRFKECPWLWVLLVSVVFSFSLAGYLLTAIGFMLLKVNTMAKGLVVVALMAALIGGAIALGGGDNALNELIIKRLEYDESSGIKGNNRFYNNTDYEYQKTIGTKEFWIGVKGKANMKLIGGAGFKIFILKDGLIGIILALLFYLAVIPSKPDYRYTIAFLIVLSLCFMQRAYPGWYSWLFPYVIGIYIAKGEKDMDLPQKSIPLDNSSI